MDTRDASLVLVVVPPYVPNVGKGAGRPGYCAAHRLYHHFTTAEVALVAARREDQVIHTREALRVGLGYGSVVFSVDTSMF